eukprot:197915_1
MSGSTFNFSQSTQSSASSSSKSRSKSSNQNRLTNVGSTLNAVYPANQIPDKTKLFGAHADCDYKRFKAAFKAMNPDQAMNQAMKELRRLATLKAPSGLNKRKASSVCARQIHKRRKLNEANDIQSHPAPFPSHTLNTNEDDWRATERMATDYDKIEKSRAGIRAFKEKNKQQKLQKLQNENQLKQRNAHRSNNLWASPHERVVLSKWPLREQKKAMNCDKFERKQREELQQFKKENSLQNGVEKDDMVISSECTSEWNVKMNSKSEATYDNGTYDTRTVMDVEDEQPAQGAPQNDMIGFDSISKETVSISKEYDVDLIMERQLSQCVIQ